MVLARLLVPEQFGLAISITLVASSIELISDLGIAQQALRRGNAASLRTLHSVAIIRGAVLALVIAAAGPLFSSLFNAPGSAWVYCAIGVAPLIRGFAHLETVVSMREYNYVPESLMTIGSQLIWTIVSIMSAFIMPDYRAMVFGFVASSIGTVVITHMTSSAAFGLGWSKEEVNEAFRFGRPLAANGVALMISSVGDRLLIGARIGLDRLAQYTALSTAAFMPRSAVTKFAIALFVPQFINAIDQVERRKLFDVWMVLVVCVAGVFGFCYMAFGQAVVTIVFGDNYRPDSSSVALIAGLACIRYMTAIPTAPSLASGRTSLVLLNTTLATCGLVLGAICLCFSKDLHFLIGAMIIGEGAGLVWILWKFEQQFAVSRVVLWTAVSVPLVMLLVVGVSLVAVPNLPESSRYGLCGLGVFGQLICAFGLLRFSDLNLQTILLMVLPRRRPVEEVVAK